MKRDVIPTGLFTRTKYNNMNNYDTWLFEPYEKHYNEMEKLEAHLEEPVSYTHLTLPTKA